MNKTAELRSAKAAAAAALLPYGFVNLGPGRLEIAACVAEAAIRLAHEDHDRALGHLRLLVRSEATPEICDAVLQEDRTLPAGCSEYYRDQKLRTAARRVMKSSGMFDTVETLI